MVPPFWSLGYHQCRWGYHNTSEIETIMKKFLDYEIPVDTLWGDIDILDGNRIFTLNTKDFNDLPLLIYEMHKKDLHFIPIVDLGFPQKSSVHITKKDMRQMPLLCQTIQKKKWLVMYGRATLFFLISSQIVQLSSEHTQWKNITR